MGLWQGKRIRAHWRRHGPQSDAVDDKPERVPVVFLPIHPLIVAHYSDAYHVNMNQCPGTRWLSDPIPAVSAVI